ncbi:hypothetical protein FJZ23_03310 [Candidatus Parcubacteria bacterium]|nr:hypothetical protein [Candidatus Parcubacteria bacterium]
MPREYRLLGAKEPENEQHFQRFHEQHLQKIPTGKRPLEVAPSETIQEGMSVWRGHAPDEYRARVEKAIEQLKRFL